MIEERFAFGENWRRFLATLTPEGIASAGQSLSSKLGSLGGKTFLDIGSGSGLFSLAATQLGAQVHSFDFDANSVACTQELRRRHAGGARWTVESGSVLDSSYLARLGKFDVVYSWGVLHHTGDMWTACENAASCVADDGQLFIALYNDQGWRSRYWTFVKRWYNASSVARPMIIALHLPYLAARFAARALTGRLTLERGMSLWHDYIDWIGGYPFEVASVGEVRAFFEARGFTLRAVTEAASGCNEFVFARRGRTPAGAH